MIAWAVLWLLLTPNGTILTGRGGPVSYVVGLLAIEEQHRRHPHMACWLAPLVGEVLP